MELSRRLLNLYLERQRIDNEIGVLEQQYLKVGEIGDSFTAEQGTISITKKKGRRRASNDPQVVQLKAAIDAERLEMADVNKNKIYEIEQQQVLLAARKDQLLTSPWQKELETQLQLEKDRVKEDNPIATVTVKLKKPELDTSQLDEKLVNQFQRESKNLDKKMKPSEWRKFLEQFLAGLLGSDFEDAWEARKSEHINYWRAQGEI